jgi:subtilase family serine protease
MGARPLYGLGPGGGVSPAQLLSFYNIKVVVGSNAIALIDAYDNGNILSDFNGFASQFNLPQELSKNATSSTNKVFQVVYQNGVKPQTSLGTGGWDIEEDLDTQWAHAMAPNAKIYVVETQDDSLDNLLAGIDIATKLTGVKEVSNSWGYGEGYFSSAQEETAEDVHFPTGKGIVYFASAGDNGSFYGNSYPAVSPNVVAVGGTTDISDNNGNLITHWGWESGGGGPSLFELKPSYQVGKVNTDPTHRSVPDVSADADPYTGVCVYAGYYYADYGTNWNVVGGTSVSSPVIAGLTNAAGHFYADSPTELLHIYNRREGADFTDVLTGWNGFFCLQACWVFRFFVCCYQTHCSLLTIGVDAAMTFSWKERRKGCDP